MPSEQPWEIGDEITGITTSLSLPPNKEVTGRVVGIDPKPPKHQRKGFMYYVVRVPELNNAVYVESKIPTGD